MKIKDIVAREIIDSRGNPTVEVDVILDNDVMATASVPSGASTGSREALELRDNDKNRFNGKGVINAVNNVNIIIKEALVGNSYSQNELDKKLIELDGTDNKERLGANALLAVSLAFLKCAAKSSGKELYEFVTSSKVSVPIPMVNIINGGRHADNNLDIQEFMIVPVVKTIKERVRLAAEVFHSLKKILNERNLSTAVGDEGGFAPNLANNQEAFDLIVEAINKAGYIPGKDVFIAIDAAASEFYNKDKNVYVVDGKELNSDELTNYYMSLVNQYPILSIEDPFYEDDFESLRKITSLVGDRVMIVGDDHFVTNGKYLQKGIDSKAGNAILLKANQIGTVSEMIKTILLAKKNNYKTIISHRSGETEDTFIADLAVGLNLGFIKTGSMSRGERVAKYNRLIRIEEKLTK